MNEALMSKATFSEICKIMSHKEGTIRGCMKSIVKLSVLLLPGIMCKEFASAAALESGLFKVDVMDVIATFQETTSRDSGTVVRTIVTSRAKIMMIAPD